MTDLFMENINKIRPIAEKIVSYNSSKFEVDELVNEAYIGFHRAITNNPEVFSTGWQRVLSRAKFDMLDYVRKKNGSRRKEVDKRCSVGKRVKLASIYSMPFQRNDDKEVNVFFEPVSQEDCFEAFENEDFLDCLLSRVHLTNDEWTIIQSYFYEENYLQDVGKEIGLSEARTSQKKKYMIERLNEAAEEMLV
jgi:RNA polymerase sigma factor (sigma-70 family)